MDDEGYAMNVSSGHLIDCSEKRDGSAVIIWSIRS